MRFSFCLDPGRPWADCLALAEHLDAAGWHAAYVCDHFMPYDPAGRPADGPMLEGWTLLTALAARTRRLRLGTLVLGNTYRHPAVVANMAATLDQVSGGRLVLGLGAGWQPNEHSAYGIPLLPPGRRLDAFEEACAAIRSLLGVRRTALDGEFYRLVDAPCDPKPVQARLPILIGGAGERRTLRIAARHADIWHAWGSVAELGRRSAVLDRHCAQVGRDPATVARATGATVILSGAEGGGTEPDPSAVCGPPAQVLEVLAAYRAAGADEFIVRDDRAVPLDVARDTLTRLWLQVAPSLVPSTG